MKLLPALLMAVSVNAFAVTERMDIDDLNMYQVDCEHKEEQIRFLDTQAVGRTEMIWATMDTSGPIGTIVSYLRGQLKQNRAMTRYEYNAVVRSIKRDIELQCVDQNALQEEFNRNELRRKQFLEKKYGR